MAALSVIERGDGTPVVFLHGWSVDHRIMLPLDESLAAHRRPWRRLYPDLPGFGETSANGAVDHADDIAHAVDEFIAAEVGDEPFAVVGGSFGAGLARRLLALHPERVLGAAMICPTAEPIERRDLPAAAVADRDDDLLADLDETVRDQFTSVTVRQTRAVWERFERSVIPGLRAADPDVVARVRPRLSQSPESIGTLYPGPVLMLLGRNDTVVGWRDQLALAEHYPNSTVAVLDRCGHNAHLEYPEIVAAHLSTWLDAIRSEA